MTEEQDNKRRIPEIIHENVKKFCLELEYDIGMDVFTVRILRDEKFMYSMTVNASDLIDAIHSLEDLRL